MTDLIRSGDRSEKVADVQSRLRALSFVVDDEAGAFASSTLLAVKTFQQQRGLIADGIVGPDTWSQLVEAGWRLGDRILYMRYPAFRGDDVLTLQARLNALGFDAGMEDGILGIDTDHAVKSFQREYGVAEDGIVGPHTTAALTGLRIDRPETAAGLREELRRSEHEGIHQALVAIDPGHGADDRGGGDGAVIAGRGWGGAGVMTEADLCWDLATRLAERLARQGARVRFTRLEAENPDSSARAERANEISADIFISLHLNAHTEPTAEGSSTYFWRTSRAGAQLAELIQDELRNLGLKDCRSHAGSFEILRETGMPAVLVEPAYLTNPDDAKRLEDPDFRTAVADSLAVAVRRYFENQ
ncbi:MAG: N-acetylmuramoyl-L-alanine amidase [Actinomycetota bacterium]|nr:N-acetylmuramoyl-L-alanine amidase [Actinomycetota bacterium]